MSRRDWVSMRGQDRPAVEAILREQERTCPGACGKFLQTYEKPNVWLFKDERRQIRSVVVQPRRSLYPVLCGEEDIPSPFFLFKDHNTYWNEKLVHSMQCVYPEARIFAQSLYRRFNLKPKEDIDYDLLEMQTPPPESDTQCDLEGLILRAPDRIADQKELLALESAYQQEEVMTGNSTVDPGTVQYILDRIFSRGHILVAEYNGMLIGKINTNTESFTRFQIGGVYVYPRYRNRGVARRMTAEFSRALMEQGKAVTLFVKKSNTPALALYHRLGFKFISDYNIAYY